MRRIFKTVCIALGIIIGSSRQASTGYGFNVVMRQGGSVWVVSGPADPRISPSMQLALTQANPKATSGDFSWREIRPGFQVSELPVLAGGAEVDRIVLARIDPARFRFAVKNRPSGDKDLQGWMKLLGAALVINGSYFSSDGTPVTPLLSDGVRSGPADYDATHGAFVASKSSAGVEDLATRHWSTAFAGTDNAMVSYPMLIGSDGNSRAEAVELAGQPQFRRAGCRGIYRAGNNPGRVLLAQPPGRFPASVAAEPQDARSISTAAGWRVREFRSTGLCVTSAAGLR